MQNVSYQYDGFGNMTQSSGTNANGQYVYNNFGDVVQKTVNGVITQYEYFLPGAVSKITDAFGKTETWSYNSYLLPTQYTDRSQNTFTYTYTFSNLVTDKSCGTQGTAVEYNVKGQKTKETNKESGDYTAYTYDNDGNINSVTHKIGANMLTVSNITYDVSGRITSFKDSAGAQTSYTYNSLG